MASIFCLSLLMFTAVSSAGEQTRNACANALFCDGFEDDTPDHLPGEPWSEETYGSGAIIAISRERAFSGEQS
ncbi:MAG TPA: hypothetical protein VKB34_14340, partial [Povalibacter sp.]|nr:hypothetical protein [Povalibacter sp.]